MKSFYSADYDQLVTHCERDYPPGSAPHELTLALPDPDEISDLKDEIADLKGDLTSAYSDINELELQVSDLEYELENANP